LNLHNFTWLLNLCQGQ